MNINLLNVLTVLSCFDNCLYFSATRQYCYFLFRGNFKTYLNFEWNGWIILVLFLLVNVTQYWLMKLRLSLYDFCPYHWPKQNLVSYVWYECLKRETPMASAVWLRDSFEFLEVVIDICNNVHCLWLQSLFFNMKEQTMNMNKQWIQ